MKKLIIILLLFGINYTVIATSELILKFNTVIEKDQWLVWYLNDGGKPYSGFNIENWNDNIFLMIKNRNKLKKTKEQIQHIKRKLYEDYLIYN